MFLFYSVGSSGPCQSAVVRLILGINMAAFPLVVVVVVYSTRVRVYPICLPLYDPISTTHFHSFFFGFYARPAQNERNKTIVRYFHLPVFWIQSFSSVQFCSSLIGARVFQTQKQPNTRNFFIDAPGQFSRSSLRQKSTCFLLLLFFFSSRQNNGRGLAETSLGGGGVETRK